tara:strand:- start:2391 stop:2777 length:387 start_codon:yes stop_codon:yes gene_type:complete
MKALRTKYENGGEVADRKPGDVYVEDNQFYQVNRAGSAAKKMTARDVISYLDERDALETPGLAGQRTRAGGKAAATRGIVEAISSGNFDEISEYINPDANVVISGLAMRRKSDDRVDTPVGRGAIRFR